MVEQGWVKKTHPVIGFWQVLRVYQLMNKNPLMNPPRQHAQQHAGHFGCGDDFVALLVVNGSLQGRHRGRTNNKSVFFIGFTHNQGKPWFCLKPKDLARAMQQQGTRFNPTRLIGNHLGNRLV
jgi:hypothetical protein